MKKFLTTFAALAATFAAQATTPSELGSEEQGAQAAPKSDSFAGPQRREGIVTVRSETGDLFAFLMERSATTGELIAQHQSHVSHESHSSHSSHASHSSHYSGR